MSFHSTESCAGPVLDMSLPSGLQVRDTMCSRAIPGRIQLAVSKVLLSGALRSWGLDQGIALRPLLQ